MPLSHTRNLFVLIFSKILLFWCWWYLGKRFLPLWVLYGLCNLLSFDFGIFYYLTQPMRSNGKLKSTKHYREVISWLYVSLLYKAIRIRQRLLVSNCATFRHYTKMNMLVSVSIKVRFLFGIDLSFWSHIHMNSIS